MIDRRAAVLGLGAVLAAPLAAEAQPSVMANRHPRLVTFRGLPGQSTTIQNSSSLRIGCGTRQAGHIAVSVSVSTTGSSKLICLLRYPLSALVGALTAISNPIRLRPLIKAATINNDGCRRARESARACEALLHSG
jgi:hypothetical protein